VDKEITAAIEELAEGSRRLAEAAGRWVRRGRVLI